MYLSPEYAPCQASPVPVEMKVNGSAHFWSTVYVKEKLGNWRKAPLKSISSDYIYWKNIPSWTSIPISLQFEFFRQEKTPYLGIWIESDFSTLLKSVQFLLEVVNPCGSVTWKDFVSKLKAMQLFPSSMHIFWHLTLEESFINRNTWPTYLTFPS